jgi:hypothetical protein
VLQQVRPETVRLLPAGDLRQAELLAAQAPRPPECLQTATLEPAQLDQLRSVLDTWPAGTWRIDAVTEPARWIVYMGKYPGVEQVARKRAELRQLGITFEAPGPDLEPGLALGNFPSEAAANAQLATLAERGVRTAHVLQERPELKGQRLQLPAVDDALRPRLGELNFALASKPLRPCR